MSTTTTENQSNYLGRGAPLKWPLLGGSVLVMVVAWMFMQPNLPIDQAIGYMLRVTARLAFVLLLLAYVARPLRQLFGVGNVLMRHRRYLGLSMALTHTVHFGYVVALFVHLGEPPELLVMIGGGFAFVLMWLMAATSNNASMRALGGNWSRLHTLGMHYLWIIFMQSFVGGLGNDPYLIYATLVIAGVLALGLRVWAYCSRRFSRAT